VRWVFVCLVFLVATWLSRWPVLYRTVLDWDESLYFLMARAWCAGHLPYAVIWDNKPPGIYAIFAVFSWLCGGWTGAMRIATVLCVAGLASLVFAIVRALGGRRMAAWAGGLLLVLASLSNDGLAANTELFMAFFTSAAVLAALRTRSGLAVGLCLGLAFMVKYVAVCEAPAVLLLFAWRVRQWRPAALVPVGAALPLVLTVLVYAAAGALPLFWADAVLSNLRRAQAPLSGAALSYALHVQLVRWGTLYAVAGLFCLWALVRRAPGGWFLCLWLAGGLAGAAAAKSFYDHYFLQVLPALCVTTALAGARLKPWSGLWSGPWSGPWRRNAAARLAMAALVAAPPAWAAQIALRAAMTPDEPRAAATAILAAHARSLYVFDTQPILYALTGLTPPTRYVLPSVLTGTFLPTVAGIDPLAELNRILATSPQVIARRADPVGETLSLVSTLDRTLAADYRAVGTYGEIEIFERKS
jgi:4-amino-4-deoxy-L-arabinose transferase-like glycosyltransferase